MRIGRDTEGRRSRGLIMSEYFSFALMQKKGTKRKNQGCTYGATPAASPVAAVAMGNEMADPSKMTKAALMILPILFVLCIAIGWVFAKIIF